MPRYRRGNIVKYPLCGKKSDSSGELAERREECWQRPFLLGWVRNQRPKRNSAMEIASRPLRNSSLHAPTFFLEKKNYVTRRKVLALNVEQNASIRRKC
jgi:hypothetical protein